MSTMALNGDTLVSVKLIVEHDPGGGSEPLTSTTQVDVPLSELLAAKPEIAALTSSSTAADIVAALQA